MGQEGFLITGRILIAHKSPVSNYVFISYMLLYIKIIIITCLHDRTILKLNIKTKNQNGRD